MRAIFGLVGLLVTVGVIVWFMGAKGGELDHTQAVLKAGNKAHDEVSQIAGLDSTSGEHANHSAKLEGVTVGGKLNSLLVADLTPGGAYERYFGLKKDDSIVGIEYQGNRQNMRDFSTEDDATVQVDEAFRRKGSLMVMRDDKEIHLPAETKTPNGKSPSPLNDQLDAIQGAGGVR